MLPTLRDALRRSLPPELGEFFASLRGPFRAEGSFDVRAAPPTAVASAPLDGASSEAEAARRPSTSAAVEVAESLGALGFVDAEIVQYVVEKNGPDLDACVRDQRGRRDFLWRRRTSQVASRPLRFIKQPLLVI